MDNNNELMAERDYPILATKGVVLFPHNEINIEAGRVFSKRAIRISGDEYSSFVIVVPQLNPRDDNISLEGLSKIGTLGKIKSVRRYENGVVKAIVTGLYRVKIDNLYMKDGVYFSNFTIAIDDVITPEVEAAYVKQTATILETYLNSYPNAPKSLIEKLQKGLSAQEFVDVVAQSIVKDYVRQIEILNTLDVAKELELCMTFINSQKQIEDIEKEISDKVRKKLDNNQREYILREKLRTIKEELGDVTPTDKMLTN